MHHQARILSGKKAFTLIEVLVVISIIVFLISIVTLSGSRARARARDARRVADINTIRDALVLHLSLYGKYPDLSPCQYNISTAQDVYCPQSTNWLQVLVDRKLLSAVPRDPVNAEDIFLGFRLVEPAYAGPILTETPTTPTPTITGTVGPTPTRTATQTGFGTPPPLRLPRPRALPQADPSPRVLPERLLPCQAQADNMQSMPASGHQLRRLWHKMRLR